MKPNRDHIVFDVKTTEIHCGHCDGRFQIKMPIGLGRIVNVMEGFMQAHENCTNTQGKENEQAI